MAGSFKDRGIETASKFGHNPDLDRFQSFGLTGGAGDGSVFFPTLGPAVILNMNPVFKRIIGHRLPGSVSQLQLNCLQPLAFALGTGKVAILFPADRVVGGRLPAFILNMDIVADVVIRGGCDSPGQLHCQPFNPFAFTGGAQQAAIGDDAVIRR